MRQSLTPDGGLLLAHIMMFMFAWIVVFAVLFGWESGIQGLLSSSHVLSALLGLLLAFPAGLALTFVFMVGALKIGFPAWSGSVKTFAAYLWMLIVLTATMSFGWWLFGNWFSQLL